MNAEVVPSLAHAPAAVRAERGSARLALLVLAGIGLLVLALVAGVGLGNVALDPGTTVALLAHRLLGWPVAPTWAPTSETIVLELRLPRVLTAMAVGAALSLAGTTFQGLLRNPLADPYVLGTASGAALGAAIAVLLPVRLFVLGLGVIHGLAFIGALGAVALVYRLSRASSLGSLTGLLLTGYAVGSLLAAGLALTLYLSGAHLRQIVFYLLGGFGTVSWPHLVAALPLIALGGAVLLLRARSLNALLLGEEAAAHLGIDVTRERALLLATAALLTAAAVAVSGLIGFVGLVVPHVTRLLVGPNARLVLPLGALYGGAFLAFADLVARIPGELPVGIITAVVGAPFFLALIRRARAGYEL
ncbi:MAG TPA: iron chelate uptake ABC transporter family permease subunit [Candidatus Limnocylindrales bacterium]|jgi:iron complex transport system permease protein|nr:iron chelate uptake ABC transporter family permease subunit [Candidatus Limnocylindrales bacterium]